MTVSFLRKKSKTELFLYLSAAAHAENPSNTVTYTAINGAKIYANATADAVLGLGEIILNRPAPNNHDDYRIIGWSKDGIVTQSVHEKRTMDDIASTLEAKSLKLDASSWRDRILKRFA